MKSPAHFPIARLAITTALAVAACATPNDRTGATPLRGPAAPLTASQRAWVDETLAAMSVRDMAGQVTLLWTPGNYLSVDSEEFRRAAERVRDGVGGTWVMAGLPFERAAKTNALQGEAEVPMLVLATGTLGNHLFAPRQDVRFLGAGTDVPSAMAYGAAGDPALVREAGRIVGREMAAVGVNFLNDGGGPNLLTNFENVLLNRCYGDDPERVSELTAAFVHGLHDVGVLASVGFWPGAGSLRKDPHIETPVLRHSRARLESHDFAPFRAAIAAGADVVITSHFAAPALTGSETLPATFSAEMIRVLREELGFQGLLVTDDLSMGAISRHHQNVDAAVRAFEAGHDLLLGVRPGEVADAIAARVESGAIPRARLEASARRILAAKARAGLHEDRLTSLARLNHVVGREAHQRHADEAARRSIVLVRDAGERIPLADPGALDVLSVTYEREDFEAAGRAFDQALRDGVGSLATARLSPESDAATYDALLPTALESDVVLISIYLRPQLWESAPPEVSERLRSFVARLRSEGRHPVFLSFARLPMVDDFPGARTLLLAWSEQAVMQRAAAAALLGDAPITGTLPVTLSPDHPTGSGLRRAGRDARATDQPSSNRR